MPEIETERLLLRGWRASDAEPIMSIFKDAENSKYIGGVKPRWQAWRHFAMILGHWHLRGFTAFAVEEKASGNALGYVGPWYPEEWPEPEIGYALLPEAQGKGYATEASLASLKYAYDELGWETAISLIDKENIGSKHVAGKLGASHEEDALLFGEHAAEVWRHLPPQEFRERFA